MVSHFPHSVDFVAAGTRVPVCCWEGPPGHVTDRSSSILPTALESHSAQVSPEAPARRQQGRWHLEQSCLVTGLAQPQPAPYGAQTAATTGLPQCRSGCSFACVPTDSLSKAEVNGPASPAQAQPGFGVPLQAQTSQCSFPGLRVGVISADCHPLPLHP